jgi:hypothetical protein
LVQEFDMAGKYSDSTTPGRGYTRAVSQSHGLTEKAGRGVPDERRAFEEQREGHFPGRAEEVTIPYSPPAGSESARAAESTAPDIESDEAPGGRIQGG